MSLQVQIMLVLSGHPGGRATLAAMKADLAVLAGAGAGWTQRIKRMASNAPGLDIFTEGYVIRDAAGWQLTDAGRNALLRMDRVRPEPAPDLLQEAVAAKPVFVILEGGIPAARRDHSTNVTSIADRRRLPGRATIRR